MPKSESGAIGRASEDGDERCVDVEERLENVLRRLGLEGKALDWVYFYILLTLGCLRWLDRTSLGGVASRRAEAPSIGGKEKDEQRLEALIRANEVKQTHTSTREDQ